MPRYRKTVVPKRRRPKTKDIDIEENLSEEDKNVKIDLLLKDFDEGVAARVKDLETRHQTLLRWIRHQSRMELMSFQENMLHLPVIDILKMLEEEKQEEVEVSSSDEKENEEEAEEQTDHLEEMITTVKKGRRKALHTSQENLTAAATTGLRSQTSHMMPPPAPGTVRSKFQTPGFGTGRSRVGWETPMVTPKFDPRLPVTTARKNKKAERAITSIFMSGRGSPLQTSQLSICVPNPENPNQGINHLLETESADSISNVLDSLEPETLQNLRRVCKMIAQLTD